MPVLKRSAPTIVLIIVTAFFCRASGQDYHPIPLPDSIRSVHEEYSGMAIWKNRLYLLPQYGSNKETKLDGNFFIYAISCDSVSRVIDGKDSQLISYRRIAVNNLQRLPGAIKKYYEGFEAITIVNGKVFLSIETNDTFDSCFLLKGQLDTNNNCIDIDPVVYATVKRYPFIKNAGYESLAYLPQQNKILMLYEYNGMNDGGHGFLLDTALKKPVKNITVPFLYFRLTDISVTTGGNIYGLNYFWGGDYPYYLDNNLQRHQEKNISDSIPDLQDLLNEDPGYLKNNSHCYARIVMLTGYKLDKWRQVASFECDKNNWEGMALFKNGALIISDANRSSKQVTTLAFIPF